MALLPISIQKTKGATLISQRKSTYKTKIFFEKNN